MILGEGALAPCPLLIVRDTGTACSLIETEIENKLEPVLQTVLGIGEGCTMEDAEV